MGMDFTIDLTGMGDIGATHIIITTLRIGA
jgi:hypothetical protein